MQDDFNKMIESASDEEIWGIFATASRALKSRGLVRTKNIVGERGEFLAIKIFNSTPGLPNLQAAPEGTQNVDALSRKGDRYSIKTISQPGKTTGVFYGCGDNEGTASPDKKFEFVIIVLISNDFQLKSMCELTWEQFLKFRRWHTTMRAWNLSLTKALINEARIIYGGHFHKKETERDNVQSEA
jgi:hypothetical protein